ncbi:hypothetical protein K523DRAFT_284284 [Schizophyllum commune Tattone D]|nr:hypothetical protein K523DRAFT_284284 [Schizophyllum commune Tattone D]
MADYDRSTHTRECQPSETILVESPTLGHPVSNQILIDGVHHEDASDHASREGRFPTAALSDASSSSTKSVITSDTPSAANLETLARNIDTLKHNIEVHKRRNQKLARRIEELEGQKDEADAQCERLGKEREELKKERDACMARSMTRNVQEISVLRRELEEAKSALSSAEEDRQWRAREVESLKFDLDAKAAELREKDGDSRSQRAQLRDMGENLDDKQAELHKMKNEVSFVRTALAKAQDARKRAEEDRTRVEGKLAQSNTAREVLDVRASAAEAHAITAEARAVDFEERAANALERVAEADACAVCARARASDAEARAFAADSRAAACEDRVVLAQERTTIAESEAATIVEELRIAKGALEAAELQASIAIADKREMLQSLQVQSSELVRVRDELSQSRDELARAHTEIEGTKIEIAGMELEKRGMQTEFEELQDRIAGISCKLRVSHSAGHERSSPSRSLSSARTRAPHSASASAPCIARTTSPATLTTGAGSAPSGATSKLAQPTSSMIRPSFLSVSSTGSRGTSVSEDTVSGAGPAPRSALSLRAPTETSATPLSTNCSVIDEGAFTAEPFSPSRGSPDHRKDDDSALGHHSRSPSSSEASLPQEDQQPGFDISPLSSLSDDASPSDPDAPLGLDGVHEKSSSATRPRKRPHSSNSVSVSDVLSMSTNKRPRRTRGSKGFTSSSPLSLGRASLTERGPGSSRRATRGSAKPVAWETLKPKVRGVSTKPASKTNTVKLGSSAACAPAVDKRRVRKCGQCKRTQEHLKSPRWFSHPEGKAHICQICYRKNRKDT